MSDFQYLAIKQITDSNCYPFTSGQLRHYLMNRHKNGLDSAVRKIGKRIYLRKDLWEAWIERQAGGRK